MACEFVERIHGVAWVSPELDEWGALKKDDDIDLGCWEPHHWRHIEVVYLGDEGDAAVYAIGSYFSAPEERFFAANIGGELVPYTPRDEEVFQERLKRFLEALGEE